MMYAVNENTDPPNQALEPTTLAVTPCAERTSRASQVVAHL